MTEKADFAEVKTHDGKLEIGTAYEK